MEHERTEDGKFPKKIRGTGLQYFIDFVNEKPISAQNKEDICNFLKYIRTSKSVGVRRLESYSQKCVKLAAWLEEISKKNLRDADKQDLMNLVFHFENNMNYEGWTIITYKGVLRNIITYIFSNGEDDGEIPKIIRWLKDNRRNVNKKEAKDMLEPDDVWKIISNLESKRDKLFVALSFELGTRYHELARATISQVKLTDYGATFEVSSKCKTGGRIIPIIDSFKMLVDYLNEHPLKDDPSAPLFFVRTNGKIKMPTYQTMQKRLKHALEKSGIKKKVHWHLFRHSSASIDATRLGFNEAVMCAKYGWSSGSKMPGTYIHLNNSSVVNATLKDKGLLKESENGKKDRAITCPRCGAINNFGSEFCSDCHMALQLTGFMKVEDEKKKFYKMLDILMPIVEELAKDNPKLQAGIAKIKGQMK